MNALKSCTTRVLYNGLDNKGRQMFKVYISDDKAPRPRPSLEADLTLHLESSDNSAALVLHEVNYHNVPAEERMVWTLLVAQAFLQSSPIYKQTAVVFGLSVMAACPELERCSRPLEGHPAIRYIAPEGMAAAQDHFNTVVKLHWEQANKPAVFVPRAA